MTEKTETDRKLEQVSKEIKAFEQFQYFAEITRLFNHSLPDNRRA